MFGSLLTLHALGSNGWGSVVVVAATFLVARPVAIWIALAGTGMSAAAKSFMAWFGPKGVATMAYSILILEKEDLLGSADLRPGRAGRVLLDHRARADQHTRNQLDRGPRRWERNLRRERPDGRGATPTTDASFITFRRRRPLRPFDTPPRIGVKRVCRAPLLQCTRLGRVRGKGRRDGADYRAGAPLAITSTSDPAPRTPKQPDKCLLRHRGHGLGRSARARRGCV